MITIQELCTQIEAHQQELFDLLGSLVRINSENFGTHGNENEIAGYLNELCADLGLESEVYCPMDLEGFADHPDYLPGRRLEEKRNVTAVWRGKADTNALMLMGHLDTVEIGDPASWKRDPLSGVLEDGKIHGRGACDDKYALAAVLYLIRLLRENGFQPSRNLLFTAYCDEEHGGSHGALAAVLRYPCECTVNLDGKRHMLYHCASGGGELFYRWHTRERVDSAAAAARAVPVVMDVLEDFAAQRRKELSANPYYQGTVIPETSMRYMGVRAGNGGVDLDKGEVLFVYYTDKTRDVIEKELDVLHQQIRRRLEPLGVEGDGFVPNTRFFHYASCSPQDPAIVQLLDAAREAGVRPPLVCGSCLSDLSVIAKYSAGAAFALGSGGEFGEEGGAHQPNEWIRTDTLLEYTKTIGAYLLKALS